MFFTASKLFWLLAQPVSMVLLLVILALPLVWFGRRRLAFGALVLAFTLQGLMGFTNFGFIIIQPLEDRFAVPAPPPANVDAIIMLGGATMARPSTARGITELNDAGDRLVTTIWLARQYPEARIVISGGAGSMFEDGEPEAVTAQRLFLAHGIAPERLVLEDASRNTEENVAFTKTLLGEDASGTTLLVTSAFHMPRSMGIFRKAGIAVVPWPTDYRSPGPQGLALDFANPVHNLNVSTVAIREWIGLVVYSLSGRTREFLPGPQ